MIISKTKEKVVLMSELGRKRKTVEQLQRKLESYLCAPQTYSHFEKRELLRLELNRVATNTDQLITLLKTYDISLMDNMDNVEEQAEDFNILLQEVELYIKTTKQ
jgi:hypothetical protein